MTLIRPLNKGLGRSFWYRSDTWYSAAYTRRLVNISALQSWKWQLICMS